MNLSTDVEPDSLMNELASPLTSSGIVTELAPANVFALNPSNPFLFKSSFHSFCETCYDES